MLTMFKHIQGLEGAATSVVPWKEWGSFLASFSPAHEGWLAILETKDHGTQENVASHEWPLKSIELDLEDEKHPRINVIVQLDNKVLKHILYKPSRIVLHTAGGGLREALEIESVNTTTLVRFRPQPGP